MQRPPERGDGLKKKAAVLAMLVVLVALVVGSLFGDRGIFYLLTQRERSAALERELDELRAENDRLADEIHVLRTDPRAIERLAREELGLAARGETVFLLRAGPGPEPGR